MEYSVILLKPTLFMTLKKRSGDGP
jgi:hypothetical protein